MFDTPKTVKQDSKNRDGERHFELGFSVKQVPVQINSILVQLKLRVRLIKIIPG